VKFGRSTERRAAAPDAGAEKKRLIFMLVLLLLVGAAYLGAVLQKKKYESQGGAHMPELETPELQESLALPDIPVQQLGELVKDARPEDRVTLERPAVDLALETANRLVERQYEALGIQNLDAELAAELLADPSAHRGEPFRVRGWIEKLRTRESASGKSEHQGTLLLDGGTTVYFVTRNLRPDSQGGGGAMGDFVRLDGLFLKAYSDEGASGWVEGPLIAGGRLERSYPLLQDVTAEDVELELSFVKDDGLESGITGIDHRPLWWTMAWAANLPEGAVDWEQAPELDKLTLREITRDGDKYRGQAFRIPISPLGQISVVDPGENPLHAERITEGWLQNLTWSDVIQFRSPEVHPDLRKTDLISGRGFFVKNLTYEPIGGGLRIAPLFVLESYEHFIPPDDMWLDYILYGVVGVVLFSIVFVWVLTARDGRRTRQLQEDLTRRRRARRERKAGLQPG
jgi:hypothetical protein